MESLKDVKICVLRVGGTNCDAETRRALNDVGLSADVLHLNTAAKEGITDYDALILPGGFSYGDYVRAGAIWAKQLISRLGRDLKVFMREERPILGICNGFQALIEMGVLPGGGDEVFASSSAALAPNEPPGYRCRWVTLTVAKSSCIFTAAIPAGAELRIPIAHGEGRFILSKETEDIYLKQLKDNGQLVLRYCSKDGMPANGSYPDNPNGAFNDIAGICDSSGKIFGLMPHPERAFYGWQLPDWTRCIEAPQHGDGYLIFAALRFYLEHG